MDCYTTPTRVPNLRSRTHFPELHSPAPVLDLDSLPISSNSATSNKPKPYPYSTYHNSDNTLSFDHFPDLRSGSGSTSSTDPEPNPEPYAYAYHYVDEILSFVELSDGSFKVPFAYHFDITNIRLYFVEFEDGSVVTVTQVGPDSCVKSNDEYLVVDNYRLQYEWNGDGEVARILQYQLNNNAETEKKKIEPKYSGKGDKQGVEVSQPRNTSGSANISMDRLREELTCAICLEICFEPSTTTCGHSFCCECLRSAADICGNRCPKCRQFISKRRSCTVNTVLWNTIQLLFPDVVEGRKAAAALNSGETHYRNAIRTDSHSNIFTPAEMLRIGEEFSSRIWTEVPPSQDEDGDEDVDAALAVRLQTMYFLETSSLGDSEAWPDDWPLH